VGGEGLWEKVAGCRRVQRETGVELKYHSSGGQRNWGGTRKRGKGGEGRERGRERNKREDVDRGGNIARNRLKMQKEGGVGGHTQHHNRRGRTAVSEFKDGSKQNQARGVGRCG